MIWVEDRFASLRYIDMDAFLLANRDLKLPPPVQDFFNPITRPPK